MDELWLWMAFPVIIRWKRPARLAHRSICGFCGPKVNCSGKGVALWKSQFVTSGDILIFIDSDIIDFDERFICGLLGPF